MNRLLLTLLFIGIHAYSISQSDSTTRVIDSFFNVSLDKYAIPGAALVLVKGDSIIFSKGYGYSNLEKKINSNPEKDIFRCGSVSKSFTATAVMILVDRGRLELQAPVNAYLSKEEIQAFGINDKVITLHQLLTHSAGFDEKLFGSHVTGYSNWMPLKEYFIHYPVHFRSEPGQILNYNDQGITLAGYIVEKVSGKPFYDFVQENIFTPLGMQHSSFNPQLPAELENQLAKSYFYDGKYKPYSYDYILSYPAAGLVASPQDIAKFMLMQLNNGKQVLSKEAVHQMQQRQFGNHPMLRGWCYGFAEWYGNGNRLIFKDGQATGFNSRLMLLPDSSWGFYLVWNRSIFNKGGSINAANRLKSGLTSLLLNLYFPDTTTASTVQPPVFHTGNKKYEFEGRYREMSMSTHDWSKMISLALQSKVKKEKDNLWAIAGGSYVQTGELLFQWHSGEEFYAAFSTTKKGDAVTYQHLGTGSYEKVNAFEQPALQLVLLSFFHISLLLTAIAAFYFFRKRKNKWFLLLSVGSLLSFSGFPLMNLAFFTTDFQAFYKGATPLLVIASWLPFAGLALTIPAILLLLHGGKKRVLVLAIQNLLLIPYYIYWNFPVL